MTRGEKISVIIDALDNGGIIYNETKFGETEFLFGIKGQYERRGWGSALGTIGQRMLDVIDDPDEWKIFENFNMNEDDYPFPWSTKWKDV